MNPKEGYFNIAEFFVKISFNSDGRNDFSLLPSLIPFRVNTTLDGLFFSLHVDDNLSPIPQDQRERIKDFDTGNGRTLVDKIKGGGYQYIIKDTKDKECCLLITDKDFKHCSCALHGNYNMRSFGLNNALMLIFAFAGSFHDTLLIHASLVRHNGYGYAFTAKSGTGKSTQVSMWLKYIPGCDLMNDDNPIVRVIDGEAYIYGSPWSGKTPCYRNIKARLGAITQIKRAKENHVEKVSPVEAFAYLLPACSSMKWDKVIFGNICNTITKIIETSPIYILHCLPNKEAAEICSKELTKNEK